MNIAFSVYFPGIFLFSVLGKQYSIFQNVALGRWENFCEMVFTLEVPMLKR
jgi:hypothetical protein